ncbi:endoplasmic reticulum-based factor for assembly of V-ATPase-domain-containing protein [Syncephalis fuscata]|nr:endoplasmic reticulum-based factor for assembly of V-ATPase-domain-containing protein [Syncephalis fuscata]
MLQLQITERIRHAARNAILCLDKDIGFCSRVQKSIPGINDTSIPMRKTASSTGGGRRRSVASQSSIDHKQKASTTSALNESIETFEEIPTTTGTKGVPLVLLEELSRRMLSYERSIGMTMEKSQYWLHELLRDSGVVIDPPLPIPPQNPELAARLEAIRVEHANREYAHMVHDISPGFGLSGYQNTDESAGNEARQTQRQLVAILNVLFSIAGVFTAVYWATGMITNDMAMRVLWAILVSLVVAAAEAWLYVRYFSQSHTMTRNRGSSIIDRTRQRRDGYQSINS